MHEYLVTLAINARQTRVNLRTKIVQGTGAFPFRRKTKTGSGKVLVRANHCTPQIAFDVQPRGDLRWRGKVSTQHVKIEEAVVIEIAEAPAPGPTRIHHRH